MPRRGRSRSPPLRRAQRLRLTRIPPAQQQRAPRCPPAETLQCRPRRGRALTPPAQTLRTPQCTPPVTARPGPAHANARHPWPPFAWAYLGVRPPGTAQPRAQEHGTPMPCSSRPELRGLCGTLAGHPANTNWKIATSSQSVTGSCCSRAAARLVARLCPRLAAVRHCGGHRTDGTPLCMGCAPGCGWWFARCRCGLRTRSAPASHARPRPCTGRLRPCRAGGRG